MRKLSWDVSLTRHFDGITLESTQIDYQHNKLGFTPNLYDQDTHITMLKFNALPPTPLGKAWRMYAERQFVPNYSNGVLEQFTSVQINDTDKEISIVVSDGQGNSDPSKVGFGPVVIRVVFRLQSI